MAKYRSGNVERKGDEEDNTVVSSNRCELSELYRLICSEIRVRHHGRERGRALVCPCQSGMIESPRQRLSSHRPKLP